MGLTESELKLLTRAGKRIYTYTYGADVRTRETTLALGKYNFCIDCPKPGLLCICTEEVGCKNIGLIAQYATEMLAMGDMCSYVPAHREIHFWPIDVESMRYKGSNSHRKNLKIAHATNQPHFKGTSYLLDAIEDLKEEGFDIELVRIAGMSNADVLKLFEDVDLIAEQFIGGFHGYTALEAMALGKPVLSYIRHPSMLADAEMCPIINTTPDTIHEVLRGCATNQYDFEELGRRGREYVEKYYSVDAIAASLAQVYIETAGFPEFQNQRLRNILESHA
jgi:hypothetical protein